jgi:ribosomal protein S18 acetylase RimI-like enzyme
MMKTENAFEIEVQDYSVHLLAHEDLQALQTLYEKCRDFMLLVDGHPAGENAAEEEFQDVPPGKSAADHFMFGIVDRSNALAGLLDVVRAYPEEATWWIGLLLLAPEIRSQGIGEKVLEGFADYVRTGGGKALMLGVVKENEGAYRFWSRMGFELVRETEPRQYGDKIHTVRVMRHDLKRRSL